MFLASTLGKAKVVADTKNSSADRGIGFEADRQPGKKASW